MMRSGRTWLADDRPWILEHNRSGFMIAVAATRGAHRMRLPVFTSLRGYRPGWLRGDAVARLTVWAVLMPEALAYASIAGVSPVVGLYAAPGALILYTAFGSSRHLVVGPMAATAALSAAAVGQVAAGKSGAFAALTVVLAITTGVLALAAGLARLGFVANFISEPVLKGFIVGLALTIIVGQVPKLLGVGKDRGTSSASCGTCWRTWARRGG
jgi:sulfate permease, SulP family